MPLDAIAAAVIMPAIALIGTAHSMKRHAFGAVSTFSVFFPSGPMSLAGGMTLVLGIGLFTVWVIATSVWLIRSGGASVAVS